MTQIRYSPKYINALLICHLPLIFGLTVFNFSLNVSGTPELHNHLMTVTEIVGLSPLLLLLLSKFPVKNTDGLRAEQMTPPLITGIVIILQIKNLYLRLTGIVNDVHGFTLQGVHVPLLILGESLPSLKSRIRLADSAGRLPEIILISIGLFTVILSIPEVRSINPDFIYIFSTVSATLLSAAGIAFFWLTKFASANSKMLSIILYYCIQAVGLSFFIPAFDSQINASLLYIGTIFALALDSVFLRPDVLVENGFSLSAANRKLRDVYEKKLTDSANLAMATLDSLSAQICILNADGEITAVNRAWRQGVLKSESADPAEIIGKNYLQLCRSGISFHSAKHLEPLILNILRGEREESSVNYPSPSSSGIKWFLCRLSCFESSNGRSVVVAHEDISELKAAEEELLLKSAAVEGANDGIVLADPSLPEFPVVYASPGFLKLTGYSLEEVIGRNCRFLQGPDTDLQTVRKIRDALLHEQPFTGDIVNYKKNGEMWINRLKLEPIRDENGRLLRYLGVQRNVTEQIRLEEERNKLLSKEREARIATEKHFQEAKAANALKDEFLATLSHELRTPAGVIGGFVELLKYETLSEDEQNEALDAIERNSRSLVTLIDDILDVSRVITGKFKLNPKPVDLCAVVESVISAEILAAQTKNIRIVTEFDPSLGPVYGDTTRLQQIFWNLLSNAIKFTPRNGRVKVTLESSGARALVKIADTGVGIDPKFLPHVFERFRQQDSGMNRVYGGLGLGLSIVKHLVELHGGTVWAESQGTGRGSVFTVSLPVLTAAG